MRAHSCVLNLTFPSSSTSSTHTTHPSQINRGFTGGCRVTIIEPGTSREREDDRNQPLCPRLLRSPRRRHEARSFPTKLNIQPFRKLSRLETFSRPINERSVREPRRNKAHRGTTSTRSASGHSLFEKMSPLWLSREFSEPPDRTATVLRAINYVKENGKEWRD